jgi:hypothetical protein
MTLDVGAMHQLVNALDMERADMKPLDKLADADAVIALAERYAGFLLCGQAPKDVIAGLVRRGSSES